MKVELQEIAGNWDLGYALHKHTLSSTFLGYNEYGHPSFDTKRSEPGEALYQLKYNQDRVKAIPLAEQIATSIVPLFENIGMIVPMPATKIRAWQPVAELASKLAELIRVPVIEVLFRLPQENAAPQLKDLNTKEEKTSALMGRFDISDKITNDGCWNALLLDDLYDTGASLEAATAKLRTYKKIAKIYAATVTWK